VVSLIQPRVKVRRGSTAGKRAVARFAAPYDNLIAFEIDPQMPATRQLFVCVTVKPIN